MPSVASYHPNSDNDDESEIESEGPASPIDDNFIDDEIEEIEADDFPSYFDEIDGRLFHSWPSSPYPLPVDTAEQERLKAFNSLVHQLTGAHCISIVSSILAHNPNRQTQVLDLCTGTGTWLMDIAGEFPLVRFTGVDIVPIATRYPLPNVNFELGNINEEFRWPDSTFDFIHSRGISWSIHDYAAILPEAIRVLRSGGLYYSGELENAVFFHPESHQALNPRTHAPASAQFFQVVNDALLARGIQPSVNQIHIYLQNTGAFNNIESQIIYIPIGRWHDEPTMQGLGSAFQAILWRFSDSVKPMLLEAGHSQAYVDALSRNFGEEIGTVQGLFGAYHIVEAFKS